MMPPSARPTLRRAPDFALKSITGEEIKLSNFKGKIVMLNFWATWSPLCFGEIPVLEKLYQQYKDKGLVVIGISVDQGSEESVKSFAQQANITYPIVISTEELISNYRQATGDTLKTIPTTFIINKAGFVFKKHVSAQSKEMFEKDVLRLLE
jgi:peroxiredoxin